MFAIPVLFSVAVVGGGLYKYYTDKQTEVQQNEAMQKGYSVIQSYYPNCRNKIFFIYQAAGLIPLILKQLQDTPSGDPLTAINKVVQDILSKPEDSESLEFNDVTYLNLIYNRLELAYAQANLSTKPIIDISSLKISFSNLLLWDTPMPDVKVDATKIKDARTKLNAYIDMHSQYTDPAFILKCLDGLAKELNEVTMAFQGRSVINIKEEIGTTDITSRDRKKIFGT